MQVNPGARARAARLPDQLAEAATTSPGFTSAFSRCAYMETIAVVADLDHEPVAGVALEPADPGHRAGQGGAHAHVSAQPSMSMPSCIRPQRGPNGDPSGPFRGSTQRESGRDSEGVASIASQRRLCQRQTTKKAR